MPLTFFYGCSFPIEGDPGSLRCVFRIAIQGGALIRITSQTAGEWSGNVFDFFQHAYEKMKQALKVPFKLDENSVRVDETPAHDALREETNPERATVFLPLGDEEKVRETSLGGVKETRALLGELSENEQAVMDLAFREGRVTTRLVVGEIGISRKSASALLKRLFTKGHLKWVGASTHDPLQYYVPGEGASFQSDAASQ